MITVQARSQDQHGGTRDKNQGLFLHYDTIKNIVLQYRHNTGTEFLLPIFFIIDEFIAMPIVQKLLVNDSAYDHIRGIQKGQYRNIIGFRYSRYSYFVVDVINATGHRSKLLHKRTPFISLDSANSAT